MRLLLISHKPCWRDPESPSGYSTDGGFPFQMGAIAELFDSTVAAVPVLKSEKPEGVSHLIGVNLSILPLHNPPEHRFARKLAFIPWSILHFPRIFSAAGKADAIHCPIPGDVGTFGVLIALLRKKPLFIRYCGRWGYAPRLTKKVVFHFLERIAGGRNVVLATGGADAPPSDKNPHIQWIFSSSLRQAEIESIPERKPWNKGQSLRLITVTRLESGKNIDLVIEALALVKDKYSPVSFEIVGEGSETAKLKKLTSELKLENSVKFKGYLSHSEVMKALMGAHIFCFPTRSEGFPKAVLEALACGLPVITSPVSVLPKLIGDKNGILLDKLTPQAIADAVLRLVNSEALFDRMARNARDTAKAYTLENWREEIEERLKKAWSSPLKNS